MSAAPTSRSRIDQLKEIRRREYCKDLASWEAKARQTGTDADAEALCDSVFEQIEKDSTRRAQLDDFLQHEGPVARRSVMKGVIKRNLTIDTALSRSSSRSPSRSPSVKSHGSPSRSLSSQDHRGTPVLNPIRSRSASNSPLSVSPVPAPLSPLAGTAQTLESLRPLLEQLRHGTRGMVNHKLANVEALLRKIAKARGEDAEWFGPEDLVAALREMSLLIDSTQAAVAVAGLAKNEHSRVSIADFSHALAQSMRAFKAMNIRPPGQAAAATRLRQKRAASTVPKSDMPEHQMHAMVVQRIKSLLMTTSIDTLRHYWNNHDIQKLGLLNEHQLAGLLTDCEIKFNREDIGSLIYTYSGGKSKIAFDDFVYNLLGMPHDFFCRTLEAGTHQFSKASKTKLMHNKQPIVCQTVSELVAAFRLALRKELMDADVSLSKVFNKTKGQITMSKDELWTLFHRRHQSLSHADFKMIMDRFDYDRDGGLNYQEFVHEMLDLPVPPRVKKTLRTPHVGITEELTGNSKHVIAQLREDVKCAAVRQDLILGLFNRYDQDGSGKIAYDELKKMVDDMGLKCASNDDPAALLLTYFAKDVGSLTYQGFLKDVMQLSEASSGQIKTTGPMQSSTRIAHLRDDVSTGIIDKVCSHKKMHDRLFSFFDRDHAGTCTYAEFTKGLKALGLPLGDSHMKELWSRFSTDELGEVPRNNFAKQLLGEVKKPQSASQMATRLAQDVERILSTSNSAADSARSKQGSLRAPPTNNITFNTQA